MSALPEKLRAWRFQLDFRAEPGTIEVMKSSFSPLLVEKMLSLYRSETEMSG